MCPLWHPALVLISYQPSVNKTIWFIIKPLRIFKRTPADGSDGIRNRHAPQTTAINERIIADGGDGIPNRHAPQAAAMTERFITDGGDGIWYRHAAQAAAMTERSIADGSDGIGYNSFFTSNYQRVRSRFNNGITAATGII